MKHILKRFIDIAASLVGLLLLSPVLLITALIVRLKLGSPVLFKQERPGLNSEPFFMYKFRTMTDQRDEQGNLLHDEKRLPPFGKLLRSTSLDELPELLCVLKGDMSLVGPRPLMMKYLPRYTPEQLRRHEARPGITGWAQVNGRNAISWEDRFKLDVWYVDNWNVWIDIKILFKTVALVFKRHGITEEGSATIEQFWGTEQKESSNKDITKGT
ncbi:MAG: sugar transferase [Planctomycetes bacterium]|nr:sugar transferase [Planctomycetota bacterium]